MEKLENEIFIVTKSALGDLFKVETKDKIEFINQKKLEKLLDEREKRQVHN